MKKPFEKSFSLENFKEFRLIPTLPDEVFVKNIMKIANLKLLEHSLIVDQEQWMTCIGIECLDFSFVCDYNFNN